jgi:hypothetical protein
VKEKKKKVKFSQFSIDYALCHEDTGGSRDTVPPFSTLALVEG